MPKPNLDHPTLPRIKTRFPDRKLTATEFRGLTTLVVAPTDLHEVLTFLQSDADCTYDFLSDIVGIDYLNYPANAPGASHADPEEQSDEGTGNAESDPNAAPSKAAPRGRFGVVYNLVSTSTNLRLFVKVLLDNSLDTRGIEEDPALHLPSVTDLWPSAEWLEREVYDMLGIRFDDHPDLRRILMWEAYPAHPLRKDYPVRGRGEREDYLVVDRHSA